MLTKCWVPANIWKVEWTENGHKQATEIRDFDFKGCRTGDCALGASTTTHPGHEAPSEASSLI